MTTPAYIVYSNDYGENWNTAYTDDAGGEPLDMQTVPGNGIIFALRKTHAASAVLLLRSSNAGVNWQQFRDPRNGLVQAKAFAYDFMTDRLYVVYSDSAVFALMRASQVDAGQANQRVQVPSTWTGTDAEWYEDLLLKGSPGFWRPLTSFPDPVTARRSMISQKKLHS